MSCPREAGIQTSSRARRWPGFPLSAGMTCDAFISNVDETCRPPFTRAEPVAGSALRRCRFSGLERLPSTSSVGWGDLHRLSLYDFSLNNFFSNSRNRVTFASEGRAHATSTARKKRRPWRLGTIFYGNWAEPIEKSQIGRRIPRESKSFRLGIPSISLGFFWIGLAWFGFAWNSFRFRVPSAECRYSEMSSARPTISRRCGVDPACTG
jgi:hypothetical protein